MGSPLLVTVANLIMEDVEERVLATFPIPTMFWKRYVDDMCVAMRQNHIQQISKHLQRPARGKKTAAPASRAHYVPRPAATWGESD